MHENAARYWLSPPSSIEKHPNPPWLLQKTFWEALASSNPKWPEARIRDQQCSGEKSLGLFRPRLTGSKRELCLDLKVFSLLFLTRNNNNENKRWIREVGWSRVFFSGFGVFIEEKVTLIAVRAETLFSEVIWGLAETEVQSRSYHKASSCTLDWVSLQHRPHCASSSPLQPPAHIKHHVHQPAPGSAVAPSRDRIFPTKATNCPGVV